MSDSLWVVSRRMPSTGSIQQPMTRN